MSNLQPLSARQTSAAKFSSWILVVGLFLLAGRPGWGGPSPKVLEGSLQSFHSAENGALELQVLSGTNMTVATVEKPGDLVPEPSSWLRLTNHAVADWAETELLAGTMRPLARNVAALRLLGDAAEEAPCVAELTGQVLAVSPGGRAFVFQDETGIILLESRPRSPALEAGQTVRIEGDAIARGSRAVLGAFPIVDNDGIHQMKEKSGKVYLTAGRHPLRLDWFNHLGFYGLAVTYQGPGLPRQRLGQTALFRQEIDYPSRQVKWVRGVNYSCYEGDWLRLPDFSALILARHGTTRGFDTAVTPRPDNVGVEFNGWFEAPRDGIYTFSVASDDGSLLFLDENPASIEILGNGPLPMTTGIAVRQSLHDGSDAQWVQVEGTIGFASVAAGRGEFELDSEGGKMRLEIADATDVSPATLLNARVRVTGVCLPEKSPDGQLVAGTLLAPGVRQVEYWNASLGAWEAQPVDSPAFFAASDSATNLPILTKVAEIKRLTREQWRRGYPVKIRGVVTSVLDSGVFIEDPTWSIYARWPTTNDPAHAPRLGDYWELEGRTFLEFAPNIQVTHAIRLGEGSLPDPLRPTWDQLLNGSLDTKYIELQGIVTEVTSNSATLLTSAGKLGVEFLDMQPQALRREDNALIRARGCVIPVRDKQTDQIIPGRIQLASSSVSVDEPAPADPFAAPIKHVSDLLLFDWRAGALQRVKITGQVMAVRRGECFLMDGRQGVRVVSKAALHAVPGNLIEAVGFVELGGPCPVLREAVVRGKGAAPLPPAQLLGPNVLDRRRDGRRVTLQAVLAGISRDSSDDVLEMHVGGRGFIARLPLANGPLPPISPGSDLELTGVYAGLGGDLTADREVTSFELLLNSARDVQVLARPSWWTVRRALAAIGGLVLVVLVGVIWIALLRQKIEERSQELAEEVRRHEHTDRQRALEAERARIAQDLHDDLGAALTQIRFLSAVESRDMRAPEGTRARLEQVSRKSRDMVESLDEIVWAINPSNDSIASLANYFCHFAEEFFASTPIRCRLDVADMLPQAPLTSEVRHHLYLAVREGLNNIAKHSGATEVWLRIHAENGWLRIVLEDNGRGFPAAAANGAGDGLANMRKRMERIGGQFSCESHPGGGALFRFALPLPSHRNGHNGVATERLSPVS